MWIFGQIGKVFLNCNTKNGVESGDHIYYDKFAGDIIEIEDDTYTVIKESDVIIVLWEN